MFDKRFKFEDLYRADYNVDAEKVVNEINAIASSAKKCLASDDFQRYKKQFENAQTQIVNALLAYNSSFMSQPNPDPIIYAMKVNQYLQRIIDLRTLLGQVEAEASRAQEITQDVE